jgi:hypothetical protein
MEAAIARIDIHAQGQLEFLFRLIRDQPRSKWAPLLSKYITFPMANNASDHPLYKSASRKVQLGALIHFRVILENEWREWIWPLFERGTVQDLLSRQEERNLFTVSMNL